MKVIALMLMALAIMATTALASNHPRRDACEYLDDGGRGEDREAFSQCKHTDAP